MLMRECAQCNRPTERPKYCSFDCYNATRQPKPRTCFCGKEYLAKARQKTCGCRIKPMNFKCPDCGAPSYSAQDKPGRCKDCQRKRGLEHTLAWQDRQRKKDPEAYYAGVRERRRTYLERHPDAKKIANETARRKRKENPHLVRFNELVNRRAKKFGLNRETWEAMSADQEHRCKICRREFVVNTVEKVNRNLVACIDHCHTTNTVRGMLCGQCNRGLGFFRDNFRDLIIGGLYVRSGGVILDDESFDELEKTIERLLHGKVIDAESTEK